MNKKNFLLTIAASAILFLIVILYISGFEAEWKPIAVIGLLWGHSPT